MGKKEKSKVAEERAREEAEHQYNKERERRLEEEHADRKAVLDKGLRRLRDETEQELAKREAAIQAREAELQRLNAEVTAFTKRLERAVPEAHDEARAQALKDMEHERTLANWSVIGSESR